MFIYLYLYVYERSRLRRADNVRARAPRLIGKVTVAKHHIGHRRVETELQTATSSECAPSTLHPFRSRYPAKSGPHLSGLYIFFFSQAQRAGLRAIRYTLVLLICNSGAVPPWIKTMLYPLSITLLVLQYHHTLSQTHATPCWSVRTGDGHVEVPRHPACRSNKHK